ncbi:hypothetical protein C3B61_09765 [Cryobacterium zongtaii]|uniref:Uncharacterized protein n=1 Tax=Cryobacterium zongtaii TaxID=1259217 RepID=A0A2S3ZFE6_9MICO|nr:hypothetical protein [Cryobacterium zongtaii]POH65836.1 hypothetical protein C3B61_09765 [Cryobacterium zongtaii]
MNHLHVDNTFSDALRAKFVNQVQSTAPVQRRRQTLLWSAAAVVVGAGLLGGVAAAAGGLLILPGSQPASYEDFAQSSYQVVDTLEAFGGRTVDYDPLDSPQDLAAASQVVVEATVVGLREGRTILGVDSTVLVLLPDDVVKGELAAGNDGNVYLELYWAGSSDPSYYAKALPSGAKVVAYMVPAADGAPEEGIDTVVDDPKAGRPDGQALFLPYGPQGLVMQVEGHDVVWPLLGALAPGNIADTLPGGSLIAK